MSASSLLGILFVALKLCGVISWSWWLVTLPFTLPLLIIAGILVFGFIAVLLGAK